jgi:AraC-like DNA-binding protein
VAAVLAILTLRGIRPAERGNPVDDAEILEHFERAWLDAFAAGAGKRRVEFVDQAKPDASAGEIHRQRESGRTRATDEDIDVRTFQLRFHELLPWTIEWKLSVGAGRRLDYPTDANLYCVGAMQAPLVNPALLLSAELPVLIAVEQSDAHVRNRSAHSHSAGQLLGSTHGLLTITAEGSWVVPATHAIWIPPRCVHGVRSHGPFDGWSVFVAEHACGDLPSTPRTVRMSTLLREAVRRASTWATTALTPAQTRLTGVILDEIASLPAEPLGLPMPSDGRLVRIVNALIADPADSRSLAQWADWAHVPARTLSRRFVGETGFTFTAWRQRARLLRSLEMLAAGASVTTTALDLGYENVSAFIALFRRTFGDSPKQFSDRGRRERYGNADE